MGAVGQWTPGNISERAVALVAALEGVALAGLLPDGSRDVRLASGNFDALVACGGVVDRYVFGDDVEWSEVRLEVRVDTARLLLHAERIDAPKAVS